MDAQAWSIARRVVAAALVVAGVLIFCVLAVLVVAGQVPLSVGYLAVCIAGLLWSAYLYMETRSMMRSARGLRLTLVVGPLIVALAMGVMGVLWAVSGY